MSHTDYASLINTIIIKIILHTYLISMERTQLSQTVKGLRKEFGMTQEELAMKSGVGLNFVRNL